MKIIIVYSYHNTTLYKLWTQRSVNDEETDSDLVGKCESGHAGTITNILILTYCVTAARRVSDATIV